MEVLCHVEEIIDEVLAKVMTAIVPRMHSESFQAQSETFSVMGNIVDSVLARSIESGRLHEPINEGHTRITDTESTIHVVTNNILGNRASIAPVVSFVKYVTQQLFGKLETSALYDEQIYGNQ